MQSIELEPSPSSKTKINSKSYVKYTKIISTNNMQHSNLKWEDIAGLDLNVLEEEK